MGAQEGQRWLCCGAIGDTKPGAVAGTALSHSPAQRLLGTGTTSPHIVTQLLGCAEQGHEPREEPLFGRP